MSDNKKHVSIADRISPSLLDQKLDLLWTPSPSSIRDRLHSLHVDVDVGIRQQLNQRLSDVVVDHGLDPTLVPVGDVRDGQAGIHAYPILATGHEGEEAGQDVGVDDRLQLVAIV